MAAAYVSANSKDAENNLEDQLKRSLRRVNPNPEFVGHLHSRLTTPVEMTIERRQNAALGLFLVAFSLLSGVFLILLLRQLRAA
ncbi:MAG: hypothetical protein EHM21_02360 [Chloroflexi bacterium]|nr:MAG: hypothetical protein EHM21_02360 [Chloroflexota bacterium]